MHSSWKWVLIFVLTIGHAAAEFLSHMNHFIQVVEKIEADNPELPPIALVKELRKSAGLDSLFIRHYLGGLDSSKAILNPSVSEYLSRAIHHKVTESGEERGVVLTSDGTTVALAPLLLGIEAGLQSVSEGHVRGLYPLTLAKTLAVSFLHHSRSSSDTPCLGPDGCWDSVTSPKMFTLSGAPSLATDAQVNGGMDGMILGMEVSYPARRPAKLSTLLKQYYNYRLGPKGLDSAPGLISAQRRQNFVRLSRPGFLKMEVMATMTVYEELTRDHVNPEKTNEEILEAVIERGVKDFEHTYTVCPTIIPRCQWGAAPFIGTPTQLSLYLPYYFIHHTYSPSKPCLTFDQCASNMRSMQSYHQNTNGWADIGYSFVAGGDGNIYEGRGWNWQGAHTGGYNSQGYGVSFIGDYTSTLPSQSTVDRVRYQLANCAVGNKRLKSNYIVRGHRDMGSTSCPGNTLYANVKTWERY